MYKVVISMNEEHFSSRLAQLRLQKGISARDMSLSMGQNAGYINNIENGKALPSMFNFFSICDFLDISPCDFFSDEAQYPNETGEILKLLNQLNEHQLCAIKMIITELAQCNR